MSPITHFLVGWVALEHRVASPRDKALLALAGIAPDIDGLGIVVDFATRLMGWPQTDYYQTYHRILGHGLPAVFVVALICGVLARKRLMVAALAALNMHLHFACDLLGSRGNGPEDIWGIYYWSPISRAGEIAWSGQWQLVSWQNTLITLVLLGVTMHRATRTGYSPLRLFSPRADAVFVATLRGWVNRARR